MPGYFGPNGNAPLPSGLTPTHTVLGSDRTYASTLQFSPLSQSHTGNYTYRLGAGSLMNTAMVFVNGKLLCTALNFVYFIEIHFPAPAISVWIATSGTPILGQSGYSLTCSVIGAEHLNSSITYQWTKNNGTQETQIQVRADLNILSFSPLKLSDAAQYTCWATISSFFLDDITVTNSQDVVFQSKSSNGCKINPCMMSLIMFTVPSPSLMISSNINFLV